MNINIKSISIVLFTFLIMASCKDDSNESGGTFPDNIQGVWQEEGWDDGDELGIYFTSNEFGYWDYMGDAYDEGEDCYWNGIVAELISRDGDNYRMRATGEWADEEDEEGIINLKVSGDMLTVTYPDDEEDEDYEEIYSKDSRSVGDLTPECSFKSKSSPNADKFQKLFN